MINFIKSNVCSKFKDPDDIKILLDLAQESNEQLVSIFEVYESEKDY